MKILLFIDHLGMGGAQRQIAELACGLKRRGHDVEVFVYFSEYDFFRPLLREHRITLHEYAKGRGFSFGVLARLVKIIRHGRFDAVISYLSSPKYIRGADGSAGARPETLGLRASRPRRR